MISKSIHKKFSSTILFTVFVLMMCLTAPVFSDTDDSYCIGESDGIFEYAVESEAAVYPNAGESFTNPAVLRSRFVKVKFDRVKEAFQKKGAASQHLRFNLFEDVAINARLERLEHHKSGSTSWIGKGVGKENSSVIFTVLDDVMIGSFSIGSKSYAIRYVGGEFHEIKELDPSFAIKDLEPNEVGNLDFIDNEKQGEEGQLREASASTIEVLVVYTSDARIGAGGTTAMKTFIAQAISETNTAYGNSDITPRLHLTHTQEVSYSESSFSWSGCLDNLIRTNDGVLDDVHSIRDAHFADVVVMIVNHFDYSNGIAGRSGAIMAEDYNAFCVVSRNFAKAPYYIFPHEIGHLQGARHDRGVDNTDYYFYFNHGYVYLPGRWRTIMAYENACLAQGFSCGVINHFSNPNVLYNGVPTGVFGGVGNEADNHRALNATASIVASFREELQDLYCTDCEVLPGLFLPGDILDMSCTVKGFSKSSSYLKYYLSTDNIWDDNDEELTSDYVGSGSVNSSESASYKLPTDIAPGNWYIIFKADANNQVSETDETNNTCAVIIRVAAPPTKPDLVLASGLIVGKDTKVAQRGAPAIIKFTVKNVGEGNAGSCKVKVYYSETSSLGTQSTFLQTVSIEALPAGATSTQKSVGFIIPSTAPTSFYILYDVDADHQVSESDEGNNFTSKRVFLFETAI